MVLPLSARRALVLRVPLRTLRSLVDTTRLLLNPFPVKRRSSTQWQRNWPTPICFSELDTRRFGEGKGTWKKRRKTNFGNWVPSEGNAVQATETNRFGGHFGSRKWRRMEQLSCMYEQQRFPKTRRFTSQEIWRVVDQESSDFVKWLGEKLVS